MSFGPQQQQRSSNERIWVQHIQKTKGRTRRPRPGCGRFHNFAAGRNPVVCEYDSHGASSKSGRKHPLLDDRYSLRSIEAVMQVTKTRKEPHRTACRSRGKLDSFGATSTNRIRTGTSASCPTHPLAILHEFLPSRIAFQRDGQVPLESHSGGMNSWPPRFPSAWRLQRQHRNVLLGFAQEWGAELALVALKKPFLTFGCDARVSGDCFIPCGSGDIVMVEAGD